MEVTINYNGQAVAVEVISVFLWCAAELLLEIFTEERCVGEAQRIGNLINGQIGRAHV